MARTITAVDAASGATADVQLVAPSRAVRDLIPHLQRLLGTRASELTLAGIGAGDDLQVEDLRDGDVLVLGSADGLPTRTAAVPAVRRPPLVTAPRRPAPAPAPPRITFPPKPPPPGRPRVPLLALSVPLVLGLATAAVVHRWEFLLFAVMSPLVVVAQAAGDYISARRTARRGLDEHAAAVASAEAALRTALSAERARRHDATPDLASVVAAATVPTPLLWSRSAGSGDDLVVRLGLGTVAADLDVVGRDGPHLIDSAPVDLALKADAVIGMCGRQARAVARSLVVQAATFYAPSALAIEVVAPARPSAWAWTRWLPHVRRDDGSAAVAFDDEQVGRLLDRAGSTGRPRRLVLVDGAGDHRTFPAVVDGTTVLVIGDRDAHLPLDCSDVVDLGRTCGITELDELDPTRAEQVARSLAGLQVASEQGADAPPDVVDWSELQQLTLSDVTAAAAELQRRWTSVATTSARVGVGRGRRAVEVDLPRDGPHLLVAGTTGSGKSELLLSLVAGLAAGSSPAELCLLLIDWKGGAALASCARLPHTLDVLTDLDVATTTRVLQSLRAELRRREQLFAAAGAADLDEWRSEQRSRGDPNGGVPRLVVVVDEFAALADELPEFVDGLVSIAQRGRSLGLHLVLATQRPQGSVSAEIRANVRLRICLAVAHASESQNVIDSAAAADISAATPGRAWMRVDGDGLVELQTARVTTPCADDFDVRIVPLCDWGAAPAPPDSDGGSTQLEHLVAAAERAAAQLGLACSAPPWLPPLPQQLELHQLAAPSAEEVAIGLVDLPQQLRQLPLTLPIHAAAPFVVGGGARSGRTSTALAVTVALAGACSADELTVWAIDGGGGLDRLRRLPHLASVVEADDVERVERLLVHLTEEVRRRRSRADVTGPHLLLVVDTWESLSHTGNEAGARCQDVLLRLLADGPAARLRVVVTCDRSGLSGRLGSSIADRIALPLADPADYAVLGMSPRAVPRRLPAGRGLHAIDQTFVQLATADEASWTKAMSWAAPLVPPRRFQPLPHHVALAALPRSGPAVIALGVGADDLQPALIDSAATAFLIAGPPGSGRSTALITIAAQLRCRPVLAIAARRGRLQERHDLAAYVDVNDPAGLDRAVEAVARGAALLVDDVDEIDDAQVLDRLEAAVRSVRVGGGFVALAGQTEAFAASFRGPVAQARRHRTGLLLRPDGGCGAELFGLRLARRSATHAEPVGRGILAVHGTATTVQLADPG